jgi:FkbH-like protein
MKLKSDLTEAKNLVERADLEGAYRVLSTLLSPTDDFVTQRRVARQMASLSIAASVGLKPIRVAVLSASTVDHFIEIFSYWLAVEGFAAEVWIAPFDTIEANVLDHSSALYAFEPDIVWFLTTARDVTVAVASEGEVEGAVDVAVRRMVKLWEAVQSHIDCTVLQNNAEIPQFDGFGNFAGQTRGSRRNLLRRYNLRLADSAPNGVVILDWEHLSAVYGKHRWVDKRYWYHSKHAFSVDSYGQVAFQVARVIAAVRGLAKKCIVLDLDGTLWGGTIGDDGIAGIRLGNDADGEAFVEFQQWLCGLKERGILLAVCSKNEQDTAKEPFIAHPDCRLKLEDFAVFRANWSPKADNIRQIAEILNIGLDSIVFIDDNPVERGLVRKLLPTVAVPELPTDPADYIEVLERCCFFETVNLSAEDRERTRYYRENAERTALMNDYTDLNEYLVSLQMHAQAANLDDFHLPRAAQLINKSNQFHLTVTRFTEAELRSFGSSPDHVVRHYKLADRFGDNGLIAVVIGQRINGQQLLVNTWVMSCRVLGRTMEEYICRDIIAAARWMECTTIVGRYVPSAKNGLVSGLYDRLGFRKVSDDNGKTEWRRSAIESQQDLVTHVSDVPQSTVAEGDAA